MNYADGNNHSTDIRSINEFLNWYEAMIDVWMERLPDQSMLITYEDLVENPKEILASIAKFTGIEIDVDKILVGDDRGCSAPYLSRIAEHIKGS